MAYKLFLDDIRMPPDHNGSLWVIARSMDDAIWYIEHKGIPNFISFDHDLADDHYIIGQPRLEKTGYDFAKWFGDYVFLNDLSLPYDFNYSVHSMNPVGAKNIRDYMEDFLNHYRSRT